MNIMFCPTPFLSQCIFNNACDCLKCPDASARLDGNREDLIAQVIRADCKYLCLSKCIGEEYTRHKQLTYSKVTTGTHQKSLLHVKKKNV